MLFQNFTDKFTQIIFGCILTLLPVLVDAQHNSDSLFIPKGHRRVIDSVFNSGGRLVQERFVGEDGLVERDISYKYPKLNFLRGFRYMACGLSMRESFFGQHDIVIAKWNKTFLKQPDKKEIRGYLLSNSYEFSCIKSDKTKVVEVKDYKGKGKFKKEKYKADRQRWRNGYEDHPPVCGVSKTHGDITGLSTGRSITKNRIKRAFLFSKPYVMETQTAESGHRVKKVTEWDWTGKLRPAQLQYTVEGDTVNILIVKGHRWEPVQERSYEHEYRKRGTKEEVKDLVRENRVKVNKLK